MGVGERTEDSSDDELSLRPLFVEEAEERNRSSFSNGKGNLTKVGLTCLVDGIFQDSRVDWGVETATVSGVCDGHLGIVGNVLSQSLDDEIFSLLRVLGRRKTNGKTSFSIRK